MLYQVTKNYIRYFHLVKCGIRCNCFDTFPVTKSISKIQYDNYKRCFDANRSTEMIDEQEEKYA